MSISKKYLKGANFTNTNIILSLVAQNILILCFPPGAYPEIFRGGVWIFFLIHFRFLGGVQKYFSYKFQSRGGDPPWLRPCPYKYYISTETFVLIWQREPVKRIFAINFPSHLIICTFKNFTYCEYQNAWCAFIINYSFIFPLQS